MAKRKKEKSKSTSSSSPRKHQSLFTRLSSGVPGLDTILGGGFLAGGTYLLLGAPGAGKTILANQLSFHEIQNGGQALFVTLLAENHGRMFGHLDSLEFFDRSKISDSIQYVSGYNALEKDGLSGLLKLLGALVQRHKTTVLFIDGVASADELSDAPINFKKFVHNLNAVVGISGCTTFLLSSVKGDYSRPEYTMVDGILNLTREQIGLRTAREIEVTKFRGSPHLYGRHYFEITNEGIVVHPRIDAVIGDPVPRIDAEKLLKTGTPGLDAILGGGLPSGAATCIVGSTGQGKTTLGSRFLEEGAKVGEKGLMLNVYEHPDYLLQKLARVGTDLSAQLKSGKIQIFRRFPNEYLLDKLFFEFLAQVRAEKISRVFIDAIGGLRQPGVLGSERLDDALKALLRELKHLGVTTVLTEETDIGARQDTVLSFDSAVSDNIIEVRHVQIEGRRITALNILKTRSNALDSRFYELVLDDEGPRIGKPLTFVSPYLPVAAYTHTEATRTESRKPKR